jgi:hypothetical protein
MGQLTVTIANQACTVVDGLSNDADCEGTCLYTTYSDVELGKANPQTALISGLIKN